MSTDTHDRLFDSLDGQWEFHLRIMPPTKMTLSCKCTGYSLLVNKTTIHVTFDGRNRE